MDAPVAEDARSGAIVGTWLTEDGSSRVAIAATKGADGGTLYAGTVNLDNPIEAWPRDIYEQPFWSPPRSPRHPSRDSPLHATRRDGADDVPRTHKGGSGMTALVLAAALAARI